MYRRSLLRASHANAQRLVQVRCASVWMSGARTVAESNVDHCIDSEKLFIDANVQQLLADLTGMDLERKVFKRRRTKIQQRSHFALMTDERLAQTMDKMRAEARRFLNFVPIKEPRSQEVSVLSKDAEIMCFDNSKFVFVDITFDANDQDRTVVVREVDGTLRIATPEEHDRMNRTYYEKPNRPVFLPPLFEDPYLQDALDRKEHEFVLDWACWFFEPDDPAYVKLVRCVFDRIVESGDFDVLHSTRHFGTMVFYLALNGNIPPLLNFFGAHGRVRDCANLVRLQKTLNPDWRFVINSGDTDLKIITDFVKQKLQFREQLKDLIAFLKEGVTIPSPSQNDFAHKTTLNTKEKATLDAWNLRGNTGSLAHLGEQYGVTKSEEKTEAATDKYIFLVKRKECDAAKEHIHGHACPLSPLTPSSKDTVKSYPSPLDEIRGKLYVLREDLDFDWEPSDSAVLKLLFSLRLSAALWSNISDCDEVYNYWEPLHLLLFGEGLQTWEYSPLYAIRSYFYIYLHYIPANVLFHLLPYSKIALFVTLRCCIGIFTLLGEFSLYKAVCKHLSISIGRFFVVFSMLSTGMFISSTAFLPSSFTMVMNMYAAAAFLEEKWFSAIFCTAISALVGWPFAAVLGLPIVVEMLIFRSKLKMFSYFTALAGIIVGGSLFSVDSYYYGKRVLAPLNIVLYNVFSEHGPDLYGTEPISFYLKNLILNWNIVALLSPLALPLSGLNYLCSWKALEKHKKWGIPVRLSYWRHYSPLFLLFASFSTWCIIFFNQPHKEERFLFPIYPLIALMAAVALDSAERLASRFIRKFSFLSWVVILLFVTVSMSRTYALHRNFSAHIEVYKSFNEHLMNNQQLLDFSKRGDPLRVCVGKEWYRFPSSFFLPQTAVDARSRKRGIHLFFLKKMNDLNREEMSRYVPLDTCDYVVDLDVPDQATTLEPNYGQMADVFARLYSHPFLISSKSHCILLFYDVCAPQITVLKLERSHMFIMLGSMYGGAQRGNGSCSCEEVPSSESRSSPKIKDVLKDVMTKAAQLVRAANDLPRCGDEYELCNSFCAFTTFVEQQETRMRLMLTTLMRNTGCPTRLPTLDSDVEEYLERIIMVDDHVVERAGIVMDELDRAGRDDVAELPKTVIGAESTRKRKIQAETSFQERVHISNPGIALAKRLREAYEHSKTVKTKVVTVKPQKEYGFESSIDNSLSPFIPKLRVKHHALRRTESTGIVVVDQGCLNMKEVSTDCYAVGTINPYQYEIQHFVVPEAQLKSSSPLPVQEMDLTPFTYINTKEGLEKLRDTLNSLKEFAVDLEHHEFRSYLGLTCLVQISTRTEDYIIDPFPLWNDMHILNEPFTDPSILKVFHGAEHDIEWLQRDFGIYVVNMFDTGRAMRRLEMQKFNLRYLVHHYCDVSLDKRHQLADWRVRPLDQDMITYARADTHYLLHCYDHLREELLGKGGRVRNLLPVVYSESALICSTVFSKPMFDKDGFRGLERRRLNSRQFAAMRLLWCWRDQVAREEDESVHYVLPNRMLVTIAESLPRELQGILQCCNPVPPLVKECLHQLLKMLFKCRDLPLIEYIDEATDDGNEEIFRNRKLHNEYTKDNVLLTCPLDFSQSEFDEESGNQTSKAKFSDTKVVVERSTTRSLSSILNYAAVVRRNINEDVGVRTIPDKLSTNTTVLNRIYERLLTTGTPYENYAIATTHAQRREADTKSKTATNSETSTMKKSFTHHDTTVERPSGLNLQGNKDDIQVNPSGKVSSSCSEMHSIKELKRIRKKARESMDISTELPKEEGPLYAVKCIKQEITKDPNRVVDSFDYSHFDANMLGQQPMQSDDPFDPFNQKFRLQNKKNVHKRQGRGGHHRMGTMSIGYKPSTM
ncbi:hypothetical protein RB195_018628 [Necator americanus]|uniref:HRDC domain-containing protein n=1 Tax=Necator americanus TaxID=51031 RepID=A0ABR1CAL5_NECAM